MDPWSDAGIIFHRSLNNKILSARQSWNNMSVFHPIKKDSLTKKKWTKAFSSLKA